MHLVDILSRRQAPAAGLYFSLTRRCPLSCAHCSTSSTLRSEEYGEDVFGRLVETFTPVNRPDVVVLTGGEPLLRPRLVFDLAMRAHAVGTRVALASGMFFARLPTTPRAITRALDAVDHVSASVDVFHEREVPREATFRAIHRLIARGQDVSLLVTGLDEEDPYLGEVIADARRSFDDRVPVMVGLVHAQGRAAEWATRRGAAPAVQPDDADPEPCLFAAWPVVSYDGTVLACCNSDASAPQHLRLGHAARDPWPVLRERCVGSPVLRAVRMFGPRYVARKHGDGAPACDGYCATCRTLSESPRVIEELQLLMRRPATTTMEQLIAHLRHEHFLSSQGPSNYRHLLRLGYEQSGPATPSVGMEHPCG